ncbi:Formate--tetrahydrofolate ligase 1 [bioreactor metagenome]|uniref:formate--tetrahydrofolate ligase n=1 Tax=bioreactor metagenome TaxID=1076179 RepID=A0A645F211_9ZZZZ
MPVVVALNEFTNDTAAEIKAVVSLCAAQDVECVQTAVWAKGAEGGEALANAVVQAIDENTKAFVPLYVAEDSSIEEKIETIVTKIYGGASVIYSKEAKNQLRQYKKNGWDRLPVCMAKTQYSLSDDQKAIGRPENFDITIRSFVPKIGAGFVVALTGDILTMPGLPKEPAALRMDVTEDGVVTGLF